MKYRLNKAKFVQDGWNGVRKNYYLFMGTRWSWKIWYKGTIVNDRTIRLNNQYGSPFWIGPEFLISKKEVHDKDFDSKMDKLLK